MKIKRQPICFVISSPSGAGKTTLVEEILAEDSGIKKTVSHTTRSKRPGEKNGIHYHFVDREKFLDLKKTGKLLEWASVYGNFYATSKKEIERILNKGHDVILVIENKGAKAIRRLFPHSVFVLILPPSMQELKKRISNRKNANEDLKKRLRNAKKEIRDLAWFDYRITNQNLSDSTELLRSIIAAERAKLRPRKR